MQPGQTIIPNSNPDQGANSQTEPQEQQEPSLDALASSPAESNNQEYAAAPPSQPVIIHEPSQELSSVEQNLPENQFQNDTDTDTHSQETINWTASEYIDHEKQKGWFVGLIGVTVLVSVVIYFLSGKDIITSAAVIAVAIMFGVVAARKPRTLEYSVSQNGLHISQKHYPFTEFKSFTVVADTAVHFVQLQPLQRFMPPIGIYYPPELEETIVNSLQQYVPYEERSRDLIDRIMSSIRF